MADLYKYGVAVHLYKPIIKRAVVDFAVGADWTPSAGDVKISKDGGAAANVTNLPTAITMGNTAMWDYSLTATEMQAAKIRITVSDSATKAVEDTEFEIDTYGNASAQHAVDLSDIVRAGLTALPNAAAEAAGGLYTRGSGAGQIAQDANGRISTNLVAILGTTLTETAGQIAAAFKKFFDKASPTGTINSIPDAVPGAAGGLLVDDVWTDARAAKLDNLDAAISTRSTYAGTDTAGTTTLLARLTAGRATLLDQLSLLDVATSVLASYIDTEITTLQATADLIKAKTDNLPSAVKKNTALAAFPLVMVDSTGNPTTGLTVTATRSIDGAAFAACANAVVEVTSGVYKINLAAGDLNGDTIVLRFTAAGARDRLVTIITKP